ncbi:Helix-turn-helix domain-containing protein [uncultured Thiomicrorhabdus sp.]
MNAQQLRVYKYLKTYDKITSLNAFHDIGVTRLAARIHELRKHGIEIETENVTITNRFGEKCTVAQYSLGGEMTFQLFRFM